MKVVILILILYKIKIIIKINLKDSNIIVEIYLLTFVLTSYLYFSCLKVLNLFSTKFLFSNKSIYIVCYSKLNK